MSIEERVQELEITVANLQAFFQQILDPEVVPNKKLELAMRLNVSLEMIEEIFRLLTVFCKAYDKNKSLHFNYVKDGVADLYLDGDIERSKVIAVFVETFSCFESNRPLGITDNGVRKMRDYIREGNFGV